MILLNIYIADIRKISNEDLKVWFNEIEPVKQEKINRAQNEKLKTSRIISDHLVKVAISDFLNIPNNEIEIYYGKHGKPLLKNGKAYFNASHSGNYVVACVDSCPCGIDIEEIRDVNLKVAERICTESEKQYIYNAEDNSLALLEIWTKKEAYFKSFGCGISTCLTVVDTTKEKGFKTFIEDEYVLTIYSDSKYSIQFK